MGYQNQRVDKQEQFTKAMLEAARDGAAGR
jgi:hypothetical protein